MKFDDISQEAKASCKHINDLLQMPLKKELVAIHTYQTACEDYLHNNYKRLGKGYGLITMILESHETGLSQMRDYIWFS